MIRALAIASVVALGACGSGPKPNTTPPPPPDPIPKTAGPDCKTVAEHMLTLAEHDATKPDAEAKIIATFKARCEKDHWTDESRSCMSTAQSEDEQTGCNKMFTPGQIKNLGDDKAMLGGAPAKAEPAADVQQEESKAHTTRGATQKKPPNRDKKTSDPCEGGQ